mgnify:CR=1 FL=1
MILIIDNYDSFTYNIVQYVGCITEKIEIFKNDLLPVDKIENNYYSHIIISPGPGNPTNAGKCIQIIKNFYKSIPILGICLGHQAIGEAFGATISKHDLVVHGKVSQIFNDNKSILYKNIPDVFKGARYHSLIINKNTIPSDLIINAWLSDRAVMGIEHKNYPLFGVQFHPESIKTKYGERIIKNFLETKVI